jgi:hypothetical protein
LEDPKKTKSDKSEQKKSKKSKDKKKKKSKKEKKEKKRRRERDSENEEEEGGSEDDPEVNVKQNISLLIVFLVVRLPVLSFQSLLLSSLAEIREFGVEKPQYAFSLLFAFFVTILCVLLLTIVSSKPIIKNKRITSNKFIKLFRSLFSDLKNTKIAHCYPMVDLLRRNNSLISLAYLFLTNFNLQQNSFRVTKSKCISKIILTLTFL